RWWKSSSPRPNNSASLARLPCASCASQAKSNEVESVMKSENLGAYNIEDLRQMAKKRLPRPIFEYVDGGAEDGIALQHNREVYRSLKIKNRVLKDISKRSPPIEIFARKIPI